MNSKLQETPVLIVGAGPVGLSMSLALTRLGVKSLVIERNSNFMQHPKARGVNVRTMEIFKQWNLSSEILKYELPKEARSIIWLDTLQGNEISRVAMDDSSITEYSPTQASFISQDNVEKVLYHTLLNSNKENVCFSHELISFEEKNDVIVAKIYNANTNQEEFIQTQYLIAADGAHSKVRKQLNIGMDGDDNLGTFCSVYCEFDITIWTKHRPCFGYFFTAPSLQGKYLVTVDGVKKWIVVLAIRRSENKDLFTDDYCKEQIRDLLGIANLPVHIINKGFWTMAAQVANQYKVGRTFLVGDAAHRMPPAGGFGMNTGIQDVHNLAWKLAMVLNKTISNNVLDSYHKERYPVAHQNILWSLENAARYGEIRAAIRSGIIANIKLKLQEQSKNLNYIGLDLGFKYNSNAVLSEFDDKLNALIEADKYFPTTSPGCRAPHVELTYDNKIISTLDLFEKDFVLFIGKDVNLCFLSADDIFKQISFPVIIYQIHDKINKLELNTNSDIINLADHKNIWHNVYEITTTGAVLVRPDGHVSWRSESLKSDYKIILSKVFKEIQECI